MNLCILSGKIVSEIEFKFIINSKNKSIAHFDMELENKSIIQVKAYNDNADYVYRKLIKNQNVIIGGKVENDGFVECCFIKNI